MKKAIQSIIVALAVSAICSGAYAVVRVAVLEANFITIDKKLARVLCLLGEKSNCE